MALDPVALANKILASQLPEKDAENKPRPSPEQLTEYCKGLVAALQAGVVSHAPGTVNGTTVAGGPLALGSASGGLMVLTPALFIAKTQVATPNPLYAAENSALIAYIMASGTVSFDPGTITGTCSSTPSSPGPLLLGQGTGGKIVGLSGAAAALAVGATGPDAVKHYDIIMTYIMENASVSYPLNSVVGTCPPAAGPLAAGAATGGIIA